MARHLAAAAALLASIAVCAPAQARTLHTDNVDAAGKHIGCYAVNTAYGHGIQCSSDWLPEIGPLDSYVALRRHGRARLAERGDYAGFPDPTRARMRDGDRWVRAGVRCVLRERTLRCRNADGHGFRIAPDGLRRF